MPRFAANLGFLYPEHAFLERFAAARRSGFAGVEFASPYAFAPQEIRARLDEHGLACALFNLPMGDKAKGDFGIACLPDRVSEFRDGVARAIAYAGALRCRRLNCIAGKALPGVDPGLLRETLVANLRYAARALGAQGIELVVEPINATDVPGFILPRCGPAAELIAEVGEANLGLQCDFYHVAMEGDDPAQTFEQLRSVIRHVQFADAPGRHEPGTGKIDIAGLFRLLDASGYPGWTSAEYRPSIATEKSLHWMRWC
jgi:hydroxypyruvate isomerase